MKTNLIAAFFALVVVAQLLIPGSMILSSERALESGKSFKFRTAPVDPYDAFRGKYVALEFEASTIDSQTCSMQYGDGTEVLSTHKKVYALISEDANGFAKVVGLQAKKPDSDYYVKVEINRMFRQPARIEFPFSKFFLEEGKAEKAEQLYRRQNRTGKQDSYAIVRIGSNGHAVIKDLVLGGIPVLEALR